MARKFWEKLSNTLIQFYNEPQRLDRDDTDARIAELDEILNLSSNVKALLAQVNPAIVTEAEFNALFRDERDMLADHRDFMRSETVTVSDTIDVIDHLWLSPADMALGPGVLQSFCGEEVSDPAANAIDGMNGTNWQHDVDEIHSLVIDLGYSKRIDGIRVINSPTPAAPLQLSDVDVWVGGLSKVTAGAPEDRVGVGLAFTDPNGNDRNLTISNGRYVRIDIGSTAHGSNNITLREIEFRVNVRTKGL